MVEFRLTSQAGPVLVEGIGQILYYCECQFHAP